MKPFSRQRTRIRARLRRDLPGAGLEPPAGLAGRIHSALARERPSELAPQGSPQRHPLRTGGGWTLRRPAAVAAGVLALVAAWSLLPDRDPAPPAPGPRPIAEEAARLKDDAALVAGALVAAVPRPLRSLPR